ncbi:winged helix-turn-helix transcriptional regulator [Streptomyces canus]|uniref:winged helix-turn-helix transcriptional regulator n=1 Tax=Streptomyces canus TaxID=58343 RepID=UPI0037114656
MSGRPVPDRAGRALGDADRARELLTGPKRFTELRAGLPGISPKTLSSRLRRFVLLGLVTRTAYPEVPPRVEYELTPAGARLEVVPAAMGARAEQDLPRTGAFPSKIGNQARRLPGSERTQSDTAPGDTRTAVSCQLPVLQP